MGIFIYDPAVSDCFGKKEILLTPIENKFPSYKKKEKSGFFQEMGFNFAPYHKELKTLEKEIGDMIGEHPDKEAIVRCFIKHKIYPEAPKHFYKDDINEINSTAYIPDEKRILDLIAPKNQRPTRSR